MEFILSPWVILCQSFFEPSGGQRWKSAASSRAEEYCLCSWSKELSQRWGHWFKTGIPTMTITYPWCEGLCHHQERLWRSCCSQLEGPALGLLPLLSSKWGQLKGALYPIFNLKYFSACYSQSFYWNSAVLGVPMVPPASHEAACTSGSFACFSNWELLLCFSIMEWGFVMKPALVGRRNIWHIVPISKFSISFVHN